MHVNEALDVITTNRYLTVTSSTATDKNIQTITTFFCIKPPLSLFLISSIFMSRCRALWGRGSVMITMIPGSRYVCSTHAREDDSTDDREERILAVLGIIGTILNLLVVIFVYIYTSVT